MATRLGDMAVGSTVKIKVNGTLMDFIIVQQGNPDSTIYDASCNGTWVLMNVLYILQKWDSRHPDYASSDISDYLRNSFFNLLEPGCRSAIKSVKIPYVDDETVQYGANGLPVTVFLLSASELGWTSSNVSIYKEGSRLSRFHDGMNSTRVARYKGSSRYYWTRSKARGYSDGVVTVTSDGGHEVKTIYANDVGVRPAFILPKEQLVSSNGTIIWNQPPEVTSDVGATGAELGEKNEPFTLPYTVTDGDGDPMTVTEKVNGVELAVRENVATGTELTVQCLSEKALFQQILNGKNTLTLEVDDGKTSTDWTATFTKNVTRAVLSLAQPLTADDTITVAAMTLEGSFPADMSLTVEMTNNARDDAPVWETVTDIQRGESRAFVHHAFTNNAAARGFAFNYKVTIARGTSGVGGNITMIGGVIG